MAVRIRAEKLIKTYGPIIALEIEKLEIETNILAIIGPNGSGKTTLLSIITGIRYPSKGLLELDGFVPYNDREKAIREISFLFDRPRLPLPARVRDVISLAKDLGDPDGVEEFVSIMGIDGFLDRRLSSLSMGQAQLVGLMVVLNMNSRIIVLDEPFAHLDVKRASLLAEFLKKKCRSRNGGCIYTTHTPWEAESLADHMVLLRDGRLEWWGSLEDLIKDNILEVYFRPDLEDIGRVLSGTGLKTIGCFGYICLVREEDDILRILEELYKNNIILGFRRTGVRKIYVESIGQGG
ncbi:MAG: ABC transporter ATP-binding protein [Crenarchaeota archaeon]|nr:ABC transporter ATP-binding protein [Thermoproteota archaeon]